MEAVKEVEEIRMNAADFIDAYKKDPQKIKKQYNGKVMVLKGDITATFHNMWDFVVINKKITCGINSRAEEKSFKELFKEEELRYAVVGNKNILVRGEMSFCLTGIQMKKCDLFYEGDTPYVQDLDSALKKEKKEAKIFKILTYISCSIAILYLALSLILGCVFAVRPLYSGILLVPALLVFAMTFVSRLDTSACLGNLLATGIKGLNLAVLLNTCGNFRFWSAKKRIIEIYKGSVSPSNWKNVELDKITKNYLMIQNFLPASFLGSIFQVLLVMLSLILGAILTFIFTMDAKVDVPEGLFFMGMLSSTLSLFIIINSLLVILSYSLYIKYIENVANYQKQWAIKK